MEITNETKAKVFAQYLGQKIMLEEHDIYTGFNIDGAIIKHLANDAIGTPRIILRPLSAITDEDAIEVARCVFKNMEWRVKRYPSHIYYLDIEEQTNRPEGWNVNIFWLKGCISLSRKDFEKDATNIERCHEGICLAYQHLQSKGYDLPHYLLDGKTLKEAGLAIYEAAQVA